jgi:hypothetical protein
VSSALPQGGMLLSTDRYSDVHIYYFQANPERKSCSSHIVPFQNRLANNPPQNPNTPANSGSASAASSPSCASTPSGTGRSGRTRSPCSR